MRSGTGWTRKRLFYTFVFAVATFAASFVLGSAVTAALGPGTSGIATIIVTTVIIVVGARIVEAVGYFTIAVTTFTVLAIPTSMFGPPGVHKLIVGVVTGLTYDFVWLILGRSKRFGPLSLPLAAAVATGISVALIFLLICWFFPDHPKLDFLKGFLKYLVPLYAFLGLVGGLLGNWIYTRSLSRMPGIQRLRQG